MQRGEDDLDSRHLFLWMDIDRNTAPVVSDLCRTVLVERHLHTFGETRQTLIRSVIYDFDQSVIRTGRIGIHARPMQDRRQILENLDVFSGVGVWLFWH